MFSSFQKLTEVTEVKQAPRLSMGMQQAFKHQKYRGKKNKSMVDRDALSGSA